MRECVRYSDRERDTERKIVTAEQKREREREREREMAMGRDA